MNQDLLEHTHGEDGGLCVEAEAEMFGIMFLIVECEYRLRQATKI